MTEWWEPAFQTTIDAYYEGRQADGLAACERLLSVHGLLPEADAQTHSNLSYYVPLLGDLAPRFRSHPIEIAVRQGWSKLNPSIAAAGDGFRMILRSSNYSYQGGVWDLRVNDPRGIVRTENYLVALSANLQVTDVQLIEDEAFRADPPPFPVSGFEDCRLFPQCGCWWMTATVRDRDQRGICNVVLLRLEDTKVTGLHVLSDGDRHEKNWMPVLDGDGAPFRLVYSCHPTAVMRFADPGDPVEPEITQPAPVIARRFRGGSNVLPFDGGHLCLVHEVSHVSDGIRIYVHRWVWFDASWRLARLSPPFYLKERGVEFAAGLAQRGDDLVMTYGVWDREAWLATIPCAEVQTLLAPPLDPDEVMAEMRAEAARDVTISAGVAGAEARITPFPVRSPSIVSTTITTNSRDIIGDALRSVVNWVDWCLVIDTGITDDTLEIAREVAGDKLVVRELPWQNDFSAARNFALEAAAALGADWAITLDTDERLDIGDVDVRAALAATDAGVVLVKQVDGTYDKERLFRLPARGRFVGPTHEAFNRECDVTGLAGVVFRELGKSHEQYQSKAARDVAILARHTAEHPDDPRWFYYLGDSLAGLGRREEAIAAFRTCAGLRGWDEEGAWAMYRAAECFLHLDRPQDAVDACADGLARHAGIAELAWLAGYAAWQAGRPYQTTYWARIAIALGQFQGIGASITRVGFRYPPAQWELPFDLLRFALRATGDDVGADQAARLVEEAKAAREQQSSAQ